MRNSPLLEISVGSVEIAVAAQRGGADRIELCIEQDIGGLTPTRALMMEARANLQIPIFVMIRPRAGNFAYSDGEFSAMCASIRLAKQMHMDGVVLGVLTAERRVDVERTRALVGLARGMQVTFHRAIDETANLLDALEEIVQTGADRILTSGGERTALEGAERIAALVENAQERIVILPGAGIHPGNVQEIARRTDAKEFHSGLSSVLARPADAMRFEAEVQRLRKHLRDAASQSS